MEGAEERERARLNAGLFTAWHTALFALNGFNDKGRLAGRKSLSDLLIGDSAKSDQTAKLDNAKLIAGFHSLKARGFDVQISRSEIN